MRKILLLLFLCFSILYGMSDKELAKTIDLAGKQRMLSQKISKEALLVFIGIDLNKSIENLKKDSALFDKTLHALQKGDKELGLVATEDKKIQAKLAEIEKIWQPFYKRVQDIYNLNNLTDDTFAYIDKHNVTLLKKMNEAVQMYANLNKSGVNKLSIAHSINIAGRQRMLTQKIAKDLLLYQAGINQKEALQDLKKMQKLFESSLQALLKGDKKLHVQKTTLPNIVAQLKKAQKQWQSCQSLIKKAIKEKENQKLTKETIACLDKTKDEMDKAVKLYTLSLNRQKQVLKLNSLIGSFLHKENSAKHEINLAGKQRMLTQRIAKLVIECKEQLIPKSCEALDKYLKLYEKTLQGFLKGDKELALQALQSEKAQKKLQEIVKLWKPFKEAALKVQKSKGKDIKAIEFVLKKNEELLKLSNDLVALLEKEHGKDLTYIEKAQLKIVNIAGRQRMLTQKMTKEKLAVLNLKMKDYKTKVQKSVILFENSLNGLIQGSKEMGLPKVTNTTIKEQLLKVQSIWKKIKPFYQKEHLNKKELLLLLKANPVLLKEMNKAVNLIEQSTDY